MTEAHYTAGFGKRLRNSRDQSPVSGGGPFFHQGAESAHKINAHFPAGPVENAGGPDHFIPAEWRGHQGHGTYGDPFVDHGYAVFISDFVAGGYQVLSQAGNLVKDPGGKTIEIVGNAIKQADTQSNGPHIQVLVFEHFQSRNDFTVGKHIHPLSRPYIR